MSGVFRVLATTAVLGFAAGAVEVAIRTSPRLGLSGSETVCWLLAAAFLSVAWSVGVGALLLLGSIRWKRLPVLGLTVASLLFLHGALTWRFDYQLNRFLFDPRVWGGVLGIALLSLVAGWLLDRPLLALGRRFDLICVLLSFLGTSALLVRSRYPAPPADGPRAPEAPNILLITLDTVRADALSPYNPAVDTPTMERLAREGMIFETAVATAPLTEPSHLALLTGNSPHRAGIVSNGTVLGDQPDLLPRLLQEAGYFTGGVVSGFPLHGTYGWNQGFHVYDDDFGDLPGLHRLSIIKAWDQVALPAHALRERRGDSALARATSFLDRAGEHRWFLWVHLFDPHGPYEAPPPYAPEAPPSTDGAALNLPSYWSPRDRAITDLDWLKAAYQGEVRYVDQLVGQLVDRLEAVGQLDRTTIFVVADHGESLGEHDYYFDHGDDLYDPSLLVPFIVRHPATVPAGLRQPCQVSTLDLSPTILDLANLGTPPREGRSLLPELRGEPCRPAPAVSSTTAGRYVEHPPVDHSLRDQGWKFILHDQGEPGLFDLASDPQESRNLAGAQPAEAEKWRLALGYFLAESTGVKGPSMDAQTTEALKALGYIE